MALRQLGVISDNLPTKRKKTVAFADFSIAGMIGQFRRQFNKAFVVEKIDDAKIIFGDALQSSFAMDALQGFFENSGDAKLWVKPHVGNDGNAIDAVVAFATINDQSNPMITAKAGYREEPQYGAEGNKTGYTIELGFRYETTNAATFTISDTTIEVGAIGDIKVGDVVEIECDGSVLVEKTVTAVDEANGTITIDTATGTAATSTGLPIKVRAFRLRTWLKNDKGLVKEVEKRLGDQWLSPFPTVSEYYFGNVHKQNRWAYYQSAASASVGSNAFPSAVSTVTFFTSGADGTAPTTSAHWSFNHSAFDETDIRFIFNPETTLKAYFDSLEAYLFNRTKDDFPICLPTIADGQDETALGQTGASYQQSTGRLMVNVGHFLEVNDPFTSSPIAPPREIPNVGHVCGAWIRTISQYGIHQIPAIFEIVIRGATGVAEPGTADSQGIVKNIDAAGRTRLAERGMNVVQDVEGRGIVVQNFFTPSTLPEFQNANSLAMRNFIRASVKDAMKPAVNEPNVFRNVVSGKNAIVSFMQRLWRSGSTGNVALGETFGQIFDEETGESTGPEDHYEVIADPSNNSTLDLKAGNRDYDVFFTVPTPTGSIKVGVGLIYP